MPEDVGFQTVVILNIYWIPFHAGVVFWPKPDFLFKSVTTYCEKSGRRNLPPLLK